MPNETTPQKYYSILTDIGIARIANATVLDKKVDMTHFAVGDGGGAFYSPQSTQTALKKERWRGKITKCEIDSISKNIIEISAIMPSSVGGFTIREMGVFDAVGALIAVANCSDIEKVIIEDGVSSEIEITMQLIISNTEVINLIVDPTVIIATKADIEKHNKSPKAHEELFKTLKYNTFYDLTHTFIGTAHTLTGTIPTAGLFVARFLTTAAFSIGDTFKINGTRYTVTNVNGSDLGLNCFASGVVVLMACEVAKAKGNLVSSGGGGTSPSKYSVAAEVDTTNPKGALDGANVTINGIVYAITGSSARVSVDAAVGETFSITFSELDEYNAPKPINYTVAKDVVVKILKATYTWNRAYIDVSTDIGQAVTVGTETKTATNQVTRFAVLPNTSYTVRVNEKAGFITPDAVQVTSSKVGETVIVEMKYESFSMPIYSGSHTITEVVKGKKGYITCKSSGTLFIPFMLPVDIFAVGGGGFGGKPSQGSHYSGGGGGGYCINKFDVLDIQKKNALISIGASDGATTIQYDNTNKVTAMPGGRGLLEAIENRYGGNGGSGGGSIKSGFGGGFPTYDPGGNGGSNGGNGGNRGTGLGGIGSEQSTRAFLDANFPLFSGGGGGGGTNYAVEEYDVPTAPGGAGGGGTGAGNKTDFNQSNVQLIPSTPGEPNTGGGGGGGVQGGYLENGSNVFFGGSPGGSGVVIIRWGY